MGDITLRLWVDIAHDLWVMEKAAREHEREMKRKR